VKPKRITLRDLESQPSPPKTLKNLTRQARQEEMAKVTAGVDFDDQEQLKAFSTKRLVQLASQDANLAAAKAAASEILERVSPKADKVDPPMSNKDAAHISGVGGVYDRIFEQFMRCPACGVHFNAGTQEVVR
jgi:hypothetical protein